MWHIYTIQYNKCGWKRGLVVYDPCCPDWEIMHLPVKGNVNNQAGRGERDFSRVLERARTFRFFWLFQEKIRFHGGAFAGGSAAARGLCTCKPEP